jgi:hypothetical protein
LYHVSNRLARGEEVFGDPGEAIGFIDRLHETKGSVQRCRVHSCAVPLHKRVTPDLAPTIMNCWFELILLKQVDWCFARWQRHLPFFVSTRGEKIGLVGTSASATVLG